MRRLGIFRGREYPPFLIPHSDHGAPRCSGLLFPVTRDGRADFICNDCGAVVRTVPLAEVDAIVEQMRADKGEGVALVCPHCGKTNEFPGYSQMFAFTCRHCGKAVSQA
jgi:hypothetical protein